MRKFYSTLIASAILVSCDTGSHSDEALKITPSPSKPVVKAVKKEISAAMQAKVAAALDCANVDNEACAYQNYKTVLESGELNPEQYKAIAKAQVKVVFHYIDQDEFSNSAKYREMVKLAEYGIDLADEVGIGNGVSALGFYLKSALVYNELGDTTRSDHMVSRAKQALKHTSQWPQWEKYQATDTDAIEAVQTWADSIFQHLGK